MKNMSMQDLADENNELMQEVAYLKTQNTELKKDAEREHARFEQLRRKYDREIGYYESKISFYESRHPELQQEFDLRQHRLQDD